MQRPPAPIAYFSLLVIGLVLVPSGVILWRKAAETLPDADLETLRVVVEQIQREYVEETDPHALMQAAIAGLVESLDNFSQFVAEEQVADFEGRELEGTYQGIGVLIAPGVVPITVQCPIHGGPAERAGLKTGDRILAVGDSDFTELDPKTALDRAQKELRGPAGTKVSLRVERGEFPPFRVDIERGAVPEQKVKWARLLDRERRLGYVLLAGFQRGVTEELGRAVAELTAEAGGTLGGVVLDLRDNTGGLLTEAIGVTNLFLEEGEIVRLERRDTVTERHAANREHCRWPQLPMVLLVNGDTASASEVVTGALQDHARAAVVGTRTYGKGVVQSIFTFRSRPYRLKITTARYVTPKGRDIDGGSMHATPHARSDDERKGGLVPDFESKVSGTLARDLYLQRRDYDIPKTLRIEVASLAANLHFELAREPSIDADPQLAKALEVLRARADAESRK